MLRRSISTIYYSSSPSIFCRLNFIRAFSSDLSDNQYSFIVHSTLELLSDKLEEIEDYKEIPGFDVEYTV